MIVVWVVLWIAASAALAYLTTPRSVWEGREAFRG